MFCFGAPNRTKARSRSENQQSIVVYIDFPRNPVQYLPKLSEHKIQNEPDAVIDDPSSIFFDPNEKPGFVYTAVPILSASYPKYSSEKSADIDNKHLSKVLDNHMRESPLSSEYDDSLDRTHSLPNTPSHKFENVFREEFEVSSKRNSLEFDPIGLDSDYHAALNVDDDYTTGLRSPPPLTHNEMKMEKLYDDDSITDDFVDLELYEEDLLRSCTTNLNNKGYVSDAESVKTYQDSGIYDDDVLMDSPKQLTNEEYARVTNQLGFRIGEVHDQMEVERFSAFKTPMSSRQNSLESMLSPISPIPRDHPKAKNIDTPLAESKTWKLSNKYSHIQAKVQCHRIKSDRSPSPGSSLRKKSPSSTSCRPPMIFGKVNNHPNSFSNSNVKAKVDSLGNVNHTPGGGERKVFNQRLYFRENAMSRTDTHGVEMYAHLPEEFQEIARRLARQESQLKRQGSQRGRSLSRSRTSSRQSSVSPTRGRSRTRRYRRLTPGNSISDIFAAVNSTKTTLDSPTKLQPSLSRSSSIRSIPSTPHLSRFHPSTAMRHGGSSKSPSVSPGPSPQRCAENKPKTKPKGKKKMKSPEHMPSPVSKLYQFTTQNDSFGSPNYTTNSMFQVVPVR